MSRRPQGLPSANRGGTNLNTADPAVPALPDFLRFTVAQAHLGLDDERTQRAEAMQFLDAFAPESGLSLELDRKGMRRLYAHHFQIITPDGQPCGDICWGGDRQRGTASIELTGAACARIAAARPFADAWGHVRCFLETVQARITRLDIAHDDYTGKHDLALAMSMYEEGRFNGAHVRPAMNRQGWNDGSGQSVYIGKSSGSRQLVVYEKGREQGLRDGDAGVEWVRWEARFTSSDRPVPIAALDSPWEFMVGQYPALDWISSVMTVIRVAVKRTKANLAGAIRHCKRQYGGLLNLIQKNQIDDEMLGRFVRLKLARQTFPAWLNANPLGRASLGRAFASAQLAV